ncbi:MAG: TetR/AcrR family transcriptional regulator [bacterium]
MSKIIDKNKKKQQILEAAIEVFARKGFKETKISSIAENASIGKGTVYEYFKSKDELFQNAFYFFMDEINNTIAKKIYNILDPLEKIKTFFNAWIEFFDSPLSDFMEVILNFWAEGIKNKGKETGIDLRTMYEEYRLMIQNLLDDCIIQNKFKKVDTHITSSLIIGALDGLMIQWVVDKNVFDLKDGIKSLGNMVIESLKIQ